MTPLITVLLPMYNVELYLEECIKSLINQTYSNFLVLGLDDGSTDSTAEIFDNWAKKDKRLKLIRKAQNTGLIDTLNIGLDSCETKYTARMDSDDYIREDKFEKQMKFFLENPDYDAVSSWMVEFDNNSSKKTIKYRSDINDIKSVSIFYSPVSHAASIFKTKTLKEFGYRKEYKYAEDYDLWIRFLQKYKVGVIPEPLYFYRSHESQSIRADDDLKEKTYFNIIKQIHLVCAITPTKVRLVQHLNFCFKSKEINSKAEFFTFNNYLTSFLNIQNNYLDKESFTKFVFTNFWQTPFYKLYKGMNSLERLKVLLSPFCKIEPLNKIKLFLK